MIARLPAFEILAALVLGLVLMPSSLVGVPGIESAAVLGVLLPPIVAAACAHRSARRVEPSPILAALLRSTLALLIVLGLQLLRMLLTPSCFVWDGVPWTLFGPYPGMLLAALVGEAIGRRVVRPRVAATLAFFVPILALVYVAWEIWSTPAVFVFTIFGGHWPGPIYDEGTAFPTTLVTYRAVTLLAIVALALGLRFASHPLPRRRTALAIALVAGLAFVGLTVNGARLGHRTSVAHVDAVLGGRLAGSRCVMHVPSEMPWRERRRMLAECEAHVRGVERALHVRRRAPLHAFVYRSAEEKGALVGAAETYVAKPWRGEVHVQREDFPHEVLRHEIVHVIAAELGPRPFRVSGALGGLWMNPGLVEGLAVAVAWEPRDGLSPDQWSRAMLELDRLPRAEALFGTGFLGQGASASYSAAGSFVAHLLRTRGADEVGRMYREGSVGDPASIRREERAWHAHLRGVALPPSAIALARVRLLDHGLLSTRCARLRARLLDRIASATQRRDDREVASACARLRAIDPRDAIARVSSVHALARAGRVEEAERALDALDADVPLPLRARAQVVVGDAILVGSGLSEESLSRAGDHYALAAETPQGEDAARALEVRLVALDRRPDERAVLLDAVRELGRAPRAEATLGARLATIEADPSRDGLASYLLARRSWNEGAVDDAERRFRAAEARGLPTERLRIENARMLARAHLARWLDDRSRGAERADALARYQALLGSPWAEAEARTMLEMIELTPAR